MKGRFRREKDGGGGGGGNSSSGGGGSNRFSTQASRPLKGPAARAIEAARARAASLQGGGGGTSGGGGSKPKKKPSITGSSSGSRRQRKGAGRNDADDDDNDSDYDEDAYAAAYVNAYAGCQDSGSLTDGTTSPVPFATRASSIAVEESDQHVLLNSGADSLDYTAEGPGGGTGGGTGSGMSHNDPFSLPSAVVPPGDAKMNFPDISLGGSDSIGQLHRADDSTLEAEDDGGKQLSVDSDESEEEEEEEESIEEELHTDDDGTLFPDILADDEAEGRNEEMMMESDDDADIKVAPKDFFPDMLGDDVYDDIVHSENEQGQESGEEDNEEMSRTISLGDDEEEDDADAASSEQEEDNQDEEEQPAAASATNDKDSEDVPQDQESVKSKETNDTEVETPAPSPEKQQPLVAADTATATALQSEDGGDDDDDESVEKSESHIDEEVIEQQAAASATHDKDSEDVPQDQESVKSKETNDTEVESPAPSPEKQQPLVAADTVTATALQSEDGGDDDDDESVEKSESHIDEEVITSSKAAIEDGESASGVEVSSVSPDSESLHPTEKVASADEVKPGVEDDTNTPTTGKRLVQSVEQVDDASEENLDDEIDKVMDVIKSDSSEEESDTELLGEEGEEEEEDEDDAMDDSVKDAAVAAPVAFAAAVETAAPSHDANAVSECDEDAINTTVSSNILDESEARAEKTAMDMTGLTYESDEEEVAKKPAADLVSEDDDGDASLRAAEASIIDELTSNEGGSVASNEGAENNEADQDIIDPTAIDSSDDSASEGNSAEMSNRVPMARNDAGGDSYEYPGGGQGDSVGSDGKEKAVNAYLPATYSTPTPPRTNVKNVKNISFTEDTNTSKLRDSTQPRKVPPSASFNDDDKTMTSETSRRTQESAVTLVRSNVALALVEPIDSRECGIGKGDIILSILSMPRKDKISKSVANGSGVDKSTSDLIKWSGRNVKDAMWRMRKLHARIEGEVSASLPVPGSIETTSEDSDFKNISRPIDAAKYGKFLQTRAAEFLRKNDLPRALDGYQEVYASYKITLERQRRKQGRHGNASSAADKELKYHPSLGAALYNIGIVHLLNASYDDALEKFEESKRIRSKKLGKESPEYIASLAKQGIALYALGRMPEAQTAFEEVLAKAPRKTPSDKSQVAEILNAVGCIQYAAGQRDVALRTFEQSLEINEGLFVDSLYGSADAHSELIMTRVASILNNIGQIGLKNRDYDAAARAFEGAFKNQFLLFNVSNSFVLATMDKLAFTNVKRGDRNKALKMYNLMLEAQIKVLGPHHIDCAQTLTKISLVHVEEKNFSSAQKSIEKVIEAEAKNENNPKVSGRFKSLSNAAKKSFKKKKVVARS